MQLVLLAASESTSSIIPITRVTQTKLRSSDVRLVLVRLIGPPNGDASAITNKREILAKTNADARKDVAPQARERCELTFWNT